MSAIIPFQFEAHAVRVQVDELGQPWFNATDVCDALEMGNPSQAIKSHVDAEDLQKLETLTAGGRQRQNHVNESGLYALILGSTKEKFEYPVSWGTDLQSEHERYIAEKHVNGPTVLMNYPKEIKAFYMRLNDPGTDGAPGGIWQISISSALFGVCRNASCAPRGEVWRRDKVNPNAS